MLNGISKIPKIPMGNPQIPILLLNGHTNSSIWSKDKIGIMKFLLISESPASLPPTQKNSTYPSQAGAIELLLISNNLFLMIQASQVFTCS